MRQQIHRRALDKERVTDTGDKGTEVLSAIRAISWFLLARKAIDFGRPHGQPWKSDEYEQSIKELRSKKCPVLTNAVILKS